MRFTNLVVMGLLAGSLAACSNSNSKTAENRPAAHDADNTARNVQDTNSGSVTPMDQGGSEADIKITQTIRQTVVKDETLSTNAHNVKIISIDGVVTLRGPVESQTELDQIVKVAQSTVGVTRVDSQLEVVQH